ncbi:MULTISPECIES: TRAP transporter small permease [Reinekea]|jgi:TRAP-type C4-dicarboxylate transport system permease small subunit|uniref:TRAP transporter small permease protein n=1 Tax=Reinekea forsetii TaxID=1336806 RepID=A0A2K8KSH3_9GAMM|nr:MULTISPECIES: TRAP transporter small permease [Reinekea]ATX77685.1 TRAP-type C4-dicarboxylate transport system, small permease component DctQ [Reinekea forsetii]
MSSSIIREDSTRLSKFDQQLFKLESWFSLIGGITISMLVALAIANSLGRWLFNLPVTGYIDWVEQFMAVFAFIGIAYCQRLGGHIRMDILLSLMKGRALWVAEWASTLFMLLITAVLVYGSYFHFYRAFTNGDSSMDIGIPIWPAKLLVPVALSFLMLRLLLQLWAYSRAILLGSEQPVGVPFIEDAATQANREAESLGAASEYDKESQEQS